MLNLILTQNPNVDKKEQKNKNLSVPDKLPRMFQGLCCKSNIHYVNKNSKVALRHFSYDATDCQTKSFEGLDPNTLTEETSQVIHNTSCYG